MKKFSSYAKVFLALAVLSLTFLFFQSSNSNQKNNLDSKLALNTPSEKNSAKSSVVTKVPLNLKKEFEPDALNRVMSKNAKTYFQLKKLSKLSAGDQKDYLSLSPVELKEDSKLRIKKALIEKLKNNKS